MKYDITSKFIMEKGKKALLHYFLEIDPVSICNIELLPQESPSLMRSDFPLWIKDREGQEEILLIEFQARWEVESIWRLMDYCMRAKLNYHLPL